MFKSIYKKLCPDNHTGRFLSQCNDWWRDGSGDILFTRGGAYQTIVPIVRVDDLKAKAPEILAQAREDYLAWRAKFNA